MMSPSTATALGCGGWLVERGSARWRRRLRSSSLTKAAFASASAITATSCCWRSRSFRLRRRRNASSSPFSPPRCASTCRCPKSLPQSAVLVNVPGLAFDPCRTRQRRSSTYATDNQPITPTTVGVLASNKPTLATATAAGDISTGAGDFHESPTSTEPPTADARASSCSWVGCADGSSSCSPDGSSTAAPQPRTNTTTGAHPPPSARPSPRCAISPACASS